MDWVIRSETSCFIYMTEEQVNKLIDLYSVPSISIKQLSEQYNIDPRRIKRIFVKRGIPIKSLSELYTKKFDHNFFDIIDSEEKAYWLGFIYADGYVTNSVFGVKLSDKDSDHLLKLKMALHSEHKIGHYVGNTGYNNNTNYCSLTINNEHLVNSLIDNGVVYNKSKVLRFPNSEIVPDELVHHFIRGYFDGDGSVYFTRYICISFEGTESFLLPLLNILSEISGTKAKLYNSKNGHKSLKIGGSIQVKTIYDYMYKDATVFLGRKKVRFDEYYKITNKMDVQRL